MSIDRNAAFTALATTLSVWRANAFVNESSNRTTTAVLGSLDGLKQDRGEGRVLWPSEAPSWTGANGDAAALETTGLAAYALLAADAYPETAAAGLRFIVANKDSVGTWYSTQATMNALRALAAGASPRGSEAEGTLEVRVNGALVHSEALTLEGGDVFEQAAYARVETMLHGYYREHGFARVKVRRDARGRTFVYVLSDDNNCAKVNAAARRGIQRTLLLMFELTSSNPPRPDSTLAGTR